MANETTRDTSANQPEPKPDGGKEAASERPAAAGPEPETSKDAASSAEPSKEKAPKKPFQIPAVALLGGVALLAVAAGGALGALLVAPRVIAARNTHAVAAPAEEPTSGGERGKNGEGKPAVFRIDNLVVNPAGSAGSHFLMAAVAFEVRDEKAVALLREHDFQLRDTVIATLESLTLDQLTAPSARDTLKRLLSAAVVPFCPPRVPVRVYLPQFVIQ